jgi:hypothetical protein
LCMYILISYHAFFKHRSCTSHIPLRQKTNTLWQYSAVIAGVVRVILLDSYDRHLHPDFTYSVLFCLSTIEVGLSFVAACAPALKPILSKLAPRLLGTTGHSRDNRYAQGGTPKASRLGYRLDDLSRNTRRTANVTQIESRDRDNKPSQGHRKEDMKGNMIVMTTETDVTWYDHTLHPVKNGTSIESFV